MNASEGPRSSGGTVHHGVSGESQAGGKKQRTNEQQFIPGTTGHSYPHASKVKFENWGDRTLPQQIVCCQRIVHGIEKSLQRFGENYKNCHFTPTGSIRCAKNFKLETEKPKSFVARRKAEIVFHVDSRKGFLR
jgi:hypothetical protein